MFDVYLEYIPRNSLSSPFPLDFLFNSIKKELFLVGWNQYLIWEVVRDIPYWRNHFIGMILFSVPEIPQKSLQLMYFM